MYKSLVQKLKIKSTPSAASVDAPSAQPAAKSETAMTWQEVVESKINSVVSIKCVSPFNFETESRGSSQATGFIVDASNGIILTNRHVISAGPVVARAVFYNHEEVELKAIYRDPLHDFGFFKFDPALIKHTKLEAIELFPEGAIVGLDIRVIGNNAGQKVSIMSSSISRIDRNVPDLGDMSFNDSNTFYIQASANISGGSSGSPMINIAGQAVAIVSAGACKNSTDMYLPLDRVKRAFECIRTGIEVKRGTIQTTFDYRSFDQVKRLGLSDETEAKVRKEIPNGVGMLVANTVLPGGPGEVAGIEEGDILLSINGKIVTHFVPLEEFMDDNIGKTLDLSIIRGKETLDVTVDVQNLHLLEPTQMLQVGAATMTNLSFQLANYYRVPAAGVAVNWLHTILEDLSMIDVYMIKSINGKAVANIAEVVDVLKTIADSESVPIKYYNIYEHYDNVILSGTLKVSHLWHRINMYTRNDDTGLWDVEKITDLLPARDTEPANTTFPAIKNAEIAKLENVAHSMVKVKCTATVYIEGNVTRTRSSYGAIVDTERGLVVVSRETASTSTCIITITIAGSATIPAKLLFQHPTYSYAIVQYNPKHIGDTNVKAISFSEKPLESGDATRMLAMSKHDVPVCINTRVSNILPIESEVFCMLRWRSINADVVQLDNPTASNYGFGVLVDEDGHVQALWLEYIRNKKIMCVGGLSVKALIPTLRLLQDSEASKIRSLKVEIKPITIDQAKRAGLSNERSKELQAAATTRNQLYRIERVEALSKAHGVLEDLDIVVSINGKPAKTLEDFDVQATSDILEMVVLRDLKELTLQVETTDSKQEVDKIVVWAGATFHAPHKTALQQSAKIHSGVYCSDVQCSSFAHDCGLEETNWVTHVNDIATPDLDSFEKAVRACEDKTFARVKVVSSNSKPNVLTIKVFNHYWPTTTLIRNQSAAGGWRFD